MPRKFNLVIVCGKWDGATLLGVPVQQQILTIPLETLAMEAVLELDMFLGIEMYYVNSN